MQLKDPLQEVNELLDKSPVEFANRMNAMADAIIRRNVYEISAAEESLAHLLADTMALSDLFGRRRLLLEIEAKTPDQAINLRLTEPEFGFAAFSSSSTPLVPNVPFWEAFQALLERKPQLAKNAQQIQKVYGAGGFALGKLPLALSKQARMQLTVRVQKKLAELGLAGASVAKARKALPEIAPFSQSYAENVYRTNLAHAYSAGRFKEMQDPEVREVAPAFMFEAVKDADTRPNHAAAHGMIAPWDSAVWDRMTPPIGFQCRCTLRVVTKFELQERGLYVRGQVRPYFPKSFSKAGPDAGFTPSRPNAIYG